MNQCIKGMSKDTCPFNPRLGCDCGLNPPRVRGVEYVTDGGMVCLKELPDQEDVHLRWKCFDQFTTYAPFKWLGSRRLTKAEFEKFSR